MSKKTHHDFFGTNPPFNMRLKRFEELSHIMFEFFSMDEKDDDIVFGSMFNSGFSIPFESL